uniref:Uncharacterized protein n=1 Tax=Glossina palpalis gambiensis TaxID=67801 RepID=A0A1B0C0Z2_9MUSC
VEEAKKRIEEERKRKREEVKRDFSLLCCSKEQFKSLEALVNNADERDAAYSIIHENETKEGEEKYKNITDKEQSLKQYFKEFKKVVENANVVLKVVDAGDPLGNRCSERAVRVAPGNKRFALILNKADLVLKENLSKWLKWTARSSYGV